MAGFASYDDLIQEITTNGKKDDWGFVKAAAGTNGVAGVWQTLWSAGGTPGSGAIPATGTGTLYTGANSVGGMTFPDVSTDTRHGLVLGATASSACTLRIYDRLVACNVPSTVVTAASGTKTLNMQTAPRYTGALAYWTEVWIESVTAITTNALNIQLQSYTSGEGTTTCSGAYTSVATASFTLQSMARLPFSGGKLGVRSVEAISISGTPPAAGSFNVVLMRPLLTIPLAANTWNEKDLVMQLSSLPRIYDGATLCAMVLNQGANQPVCYGTIETGYG